MEWILQRVIYQPTRTLGNLYCNGKFFCYTLEDKVRPDGVKVYGETAIPAGVYRIAITFSNRFKRPMIQIINVPMFEGIRIHPGVSEKNTHGCVLVSHHRQGSMLVLERTACAELEAMLVKAQGTAKCTIRIIDDEAQRPTSLPFVAQRDVPLTPMPPPTFAELPAAIKPAAEEVPSPPPSKANNLVNEIRLAIAAVAAYIGGIDRRYIFVGVLAAFAAIAALYYYKTLQRKEK